MDLHIKNIKNKIHKIFKIFARLIPFCSVCWLGFISILFLFFFHVLSRGNGSEKLLQFVHLDCKKTQQQQEQDFSVGCFLSMNVLLWLKLSPFCLLKTPETLSIDLFTEL